MNKYRNILGIALALACSALVSCSDDETYTPGPETPENCMQVYFDKSNGSEFITSPDDASITVNVSRTDASQAANVPIVVKSKDSDAIKIPATVDFAEGAQTAELTIDFAELPQKQTANFTISIDEAYADHYAMLPGTTSYSASLLISNWVSLGNVTFSFDPALITDVTNEVQWLDGLNRFRFVNFLDSGVDLEFYLECDNFNYDDVTANSGNIQPLNHYGDRTYFDWGSEWWFGNDDGTNIVWYPNGGSLGIEYIAFLDDTYSYINLSTMKGLMTSYIYYTDATSDYNYITIAPSNN